MKGSKTYGDQSKGLLQIRIVSLKWNQWQTPYQAWWKVQSIHPGWHLYQHLPLLKNLPRVLAFHGPLSIYSLPHLRKEICSSKRREYSSVSLAHCHIFWASIRRAKPVKSTNKSNTFPDRQTIIALRKTPGYYPVATTLSNISSNAC